MPRLALLLSLCAAAALGQEGWSPPPTPVNEADVAEPPLSDPGTWSGVCPDGQQVGADTQSHCCWPGQAWSSLKSRCIGAPLCPAGTVAKGEECVSDCPDGELKTADTAGHCCFPGQAWSSSRKICIGAPVCPPGMTTTPDGCLSLSAPPLPPPAPAPRVKPKPGPPPPSPQQLEVPPPPSPRDNVEEPPAPPRRLRGRDGEVEDDLPEDEYLGMGHVFFHLSLIYEPTDSVVGPGVGLEIIPFRTTRITVGADLETGLVTSFFFNSSRNRWVIPFRLGGIFGVRLGLSHSELLVHGGLLESYSGLGTTTAASPWSSRVYVGAQINLRFGSGPGYLFASFDVVAVDAIDLVGRIGWAF